MARAEQQQRRSSSLPQFHQHPEPFPAPPGRPQPSQAGMCSLPINPSAAQVHRGRDAAAACPKAEGQPRASPAAGSVLGAPKPPGPARRRLPAGGRREAAMGLCSPGRPGPPSRTRSFAGRAASACPPVPPPLPRGDRRAGTTAGTQPLVHTRESTSEGMGGSTPARRSNARELGMPGFARSLLEGRWDCRSP